MLYFFAKCLTMELYCNFMGMERNIPGALIQSLRTQKDFIEEDFLKVHEMGEPITTVRMNPAKSPSVFMNEIAVPWHSNGKYLNERPLFTADPLFHSGCYYVQEASSMFLAHALQQTTNLSERLRVLDLCAAPGGKSTLLNSLLNEGSLLVANEIIKSRVPVLADNLSKWGTANTYVSNNDPRDFGRLANYFDVLVVDAPCSGSGMFRKDPAAIDEWSEEAVKLCSQRQQRILADVYPAIKRDGVLIYSTCSYSEAENEEIADWLCQEFALETIRLNIDPSWGIVETTSRQDQNWGYRFYPQHLKGEGFYLSCFRKKDGEVHSDFKNRKQEPIKIPIQHLQEMENWIASASLEIKLFQDTYYAIPAGQAHDLAFLQERLYLKKSGTRLGKFAGKDFIPDQELALSIWAAPKIKRLNLNRAAAISYLKKEDLHITSDLSDWVLMCYEGFGLGWAKVLPKRINNYYPKEWRIINQAIK